MTIEKLKRSDVFQAAILHGYLDEHEKIATDVDDLITEYAMIGPGYKPSPPLPKPKPKPIPPPTKDIEIAPGRGSAPAPKGERAPKPGEKGYIPSQPKPKPKIGPKEEPKKEASFNELLSQLVKILPGYKKEAAEEGGGDAWPWVGGAAMGAGGTLLIQKLLGLLSGKGKGEEKEEGVGSESTSEQRLRLGPGPGLGLGPGLGSGLGLGPRGPAGMEDIPPELLYYLMQGGQ